MLKFLLAHVIAFATAALLLSRISAASDDFLILSAITATPLSPRKLLVVQHRIAAMTTEEKIGQMMMVSIPGTTLTPVVAAWLKEHHIGGVVLLGSNIITATQTKTLIHDLQTQARSANDPLFFIAVDQEGGIVSRFPFLNQMTAQKDIKDKDEAERVAYERGKELRDLGVNINFSPVLDIPQSSKDFIANRSFSGNAKTVASKGTGMIQGYTQAGIIATPKHFPGHGGTFIDSHKNLPILDDRIQPWQKRILPFREAITQGATLIMVGHLLAPSLDFEYPATLSSRIMTDVLRKDMGYLGVIITDDLAMGAITKSHTLPDGALRATNAGADILLMMQHTPAHTAVFDALIHAVDTGKISPQHLNQHLIRILLLKKKLQ